MAPLMVSDGGVRQMEFENQGIMLGVRGKSMLGVPTYREESIDLPAGSTLIFYTDGLLDRRQRGDGPAHYDDAEELDRARHAVQSSAHEAVEALAAADE